MQADMKKETERLNVMEGELSEQIKDVTKESHIKTESSEVLLCYQRGEITLPKHKLLLCSLYEIYTALEEELDRNSSHPGVSPIYFPQELARREALERDLEFYLGQDWKEKITVPAAAHRYAQRLREIGKENPNLLLAHSYTRYLGDLSGGQLLGRMTQKSLGLSKGEGLAFFTFSEVSSPKRFKELYRSRMNIVELTEEEKEEVLQEAVRAFNHNIELFDDLQNIFTIMEAPDGRSSRATHKSFTNGDPSMAKAFQQPTSMVSASPLMRVVLGLCIALAVAVGMYLR